MSITGLIIFARHDSRRLPGKVLRDLKGRPMLGRVIDRVRRIPGSLPAVVATSDRPVDDAIAAFAADEGVAVFRGAAEDVAGRALACAEAHGFDIFVRISADSPFVDPEVAAAVMRLFDERTADVATNTFPRSFPPGTSVEVVAKDAMQRASAAMTASDEKEHVTLHFYRNPESFRIVNLSADDDRYRDIRLAVDTADDLERTAWILGRLDGAEHDASLDRVAELARRWEGSRGPR